ncbi:YkyA family protein [Mesobacillus foraminis]|uniref:YkyA family protein n=1 Tax=Mesobacillus foraminis TaxID=279826 RepID=UPI0039A2B11A
MGIFRKKSLVFIILALTVLSAGCMDRKTPAEEMFDKLEKVVEIEQTFEEQQEPLVKLEKEEKELYAQLIELNMDEYEKIVNLSDQAISIADKRKEHIDKEKDSIEESKKEFSGVSDIIEKIDDPELKRQAEELQSLMIERYDIHSDLYNYYSTGLSQDKELYALLKNKDLTIEELEDQVNKVNSSYKKVLDSNQKFNEKTDQYNEAKLEFYRAAGLNVKTQDNK